uniref:Retrotransposon protein n=1 Tax=Cucumis melo TaxID=3656 RepID=A0A9I9CV15_CUCME
MAESVLRDAFVTSLEPALQAEVINRHPQTLEECMKEAQLVNDPNLALKLAREELGLLEPKSREDIGNKGLCFRCNEKYSHDHKCKVKEKRELMLFLLNEEEGTSKENSGEIVELKHLDIAEGFELKTIMDLSSKGTVRLKVVLMDNEVVVLRGVRGLVRFVLKLNPH